MAEKASEQPPSPPTSGQRFKHAALFVLFGTLLLIPRVRRLRRRVGAWTGVRLLALAGGSWLIWRFVHTQAGVAWLIPGLLLLGFALLVRAKPPAKSVDQLTQELAALIVLNGGVFRPSPDSRPTEDTQIFVRPDQFLVVGPGERQLLRIPLAKVRNIAAHPVNDGTDRDVQPWEVQINWISDAPAAATFRYSGTFAEHLARVAESTLRSQWTRDLPVIQS